jgi:uncharacterized membrane protein YraQ (UPF0718 family)
MSLAEVVHAHEALLHALPFVVPAFIVVGLIGVIIWRDRREDRSDEQ